jgi:hypothetical protein
MCFVKVGSALRSRWCFNNLEKIPNQFLCKLILQVQPEIYWLVSLTIIHLRRVMWGEADKKLDRCGAVNLKIHSSVVPTNILEKIEPSALSLSRFNQFVKASDKSSGFN